MKNTWDLSFLYKSFEDEAYQSDLAKWPEMIAEQKALLDSDLPVREKLEKLMDASEAMSALVDNLYGFTSLTLATDASNGVAQQYEDKLSLIANDASLVDSAITRFVGGIENLEDVIAASEKLQAVAFALREMKKDADHTIPAEIEPWMLQMRLSGGSAFSQLRDKLDSTHTVEYRGQTLPLPAVRGMAYDGDASVRKDAYEAEIASYKKMELPMAYCLNSIKMEARTMAKAKGHDSVLDMSLYQNRMDRETLDAMITAIKEYLPHFRRYLRAKAAYLGHDDGLPFYDLFAPVGKASKAYTIEEARELLLREMGKFTPEMAKFMDNAFEQRWIDVYPREGKGGGAFCAGAHA